MAENNSHEKAHPEFSCDLCDFIGNWGKWVKNSHRKETLKDRTA